MSKAKNSGAPAQENQNTASASNVIPIGIHQCAYQECKAKPQKAQFCHEHYAWFKFGLITKEGMKAKDFDKKRSDYNEFQKRKAA